MYYLYIYFLLCKIIEVGISYKQIQNDNNENILLFSDYKYKSL